MGIPRHLPSKGGYAHNLIGPVAARVDTLETIRPFGRFPPLAGVEEGISASGAGGLYAVCCTVYAVCHPNASNWTYFRNQPQLPSGADLFDGLEPLGACLPSSLPDRFLVTNGANPS